MIKRHVTEVKSSGARIDAGINHGAGADHIFAAFDRDLGGAAAAVTLGYCRDPGVVKAYSARRIALMARMHCVHLVSLGLCMVLGMCQRWRSAERNDGKYCNKLFHRLFLR